MILIYIYVVIGGNVTSRQVFQMRLVAAYNDFIYDIFITRIKNLEMSKYGVLYYFRDRQPRYMKIIITKMQ